MKLYSLRAITAAVESSGQAKAEAAVFLFTYSVIIPLVHLLNHICNLRSGNSMGSLNI